MDSHFDVENLLVDETFIDFCLNNDSLHKAKWDLIIEQNPSSRQPIDEAKELILLLTPTLSKAEIAVEVEKMRNLISSRNKAVVDQLAESFYQDSIPTKRKTKTFKVLAYSLSVVLVGSALVYALNNNRKIAASFEAGMSYQTRFGERKEFKLPDGSTAILNSNSSITLAKNFNDRDRLISINGDAFFKVEKNADKPFTVICPGFSTTALGTSFYVNAANNNGNYEVELLEGKLKLTSSNETESTVINAGETAEWQKDKSL